MPLVIQKMFPKIGDSDAITKMSLKNRVWLKALEPKGVKQIKDP